VALTSRRQFAGIVLGSAVLPATNRLVGAEQPSPYVRANTDWLAKCSFGIGIHWTAQTVPRNGTAKPFQKAVADFDLKGFMAEIVSWMSPALLAQADGPQSPEQLHEPFNTVCLACLRGLTRPTC
jgi:hypothetical protein